MDLRMPKMDGYEATKIIKNSMNIKNIPIVAFTASTMKADEEAVTSLFDYYLRKPITKAELMKCLTTFLPYQELIKNENQIFNNLEIIDLPESLLKEPRINEFINEFNQTYKQQFNEIIQYFDSDFVVELIKNFELLCQKYQISFFDDIIEEFKIKTDEFEIDEVSRISRYILKIFKTINEVNN
jgi:CheY-like chemotaxis protein